MAGGRMTGAYPVPASVVEVREVVRGSRFITLVGHAASRDDASRFVAQLRERHPGATHYCWAFNAGKPGSTATVGMSDAGEPHGTAGRPMLSALLHSGLGEVVAACARFYGGVKLGTGGLSRAYRGGVKKALRVCPTVTKTTWTPVLIKVPYEAVDRVRHLLGTLNATIGEQSFGAEVTLAALVPSGQRRALDGAVAEATRGRGVVLDREDQPPGSLRDAGRP